MANFFKNLLIKYQAFMYGRYGTDKLNFAILILALVFNIISNIFRFPIINLIPTLLIALSLYRSLSKDIYKRRNENEKFLKFIMPWQNLASKKVKQAQDTEHKYYNCPKCKRTLRLPKGRGKINIECPHCGEKFKKRT